MCAVPCPSTSPVSFRIHPQSITPPSPPTHTSVPLGTTTLVVFYSYKFLSFVNIVLQFLQNARLYLSPPFSLLLCTFFSSIPSPLFLSLSIIFLSSTTWSISNPLVNKIDILILHLLFWTMNTKYIHTLPSILPPPFTLFYLPKG